MIRGLMYLNFKFKKIFYDFQDNIQRKIKTDMMCNGS